MGKNQAPTVGDVVIVAFAGAQGIKRRPAVVVSSADYHRHRPDVMLGLLTSNIAVATTPFDHVLLDWASAGLSIPTAFRCYFGMALAQDTRVIGHLSDGDWNAVRNCLLRMIG